MFDAYKTFVASTSAQRQGRNRLRLTWISGRRIVSLCLLACVSIVAGCGGGKPEPTGPKAFPVMVEDVKSVNVDDSSTYVAQMDSRKTVSLHPRVDGHVVKIWGDPEQNVEVDQKIIEIDPVQIKASVEGKVASFESTEAEYHSQVRKLKALEAQRIAENAKVEFAEKEYGRYTRLMEKGAVSKQLQESKERSLKVKRADLLSLESQIDSQKAAVRAAERQMKKSKSDVKVQKEQLAYHVIRAPFAGTLGNIPVKIGDYVTPKTELTSISQARPLEAYVQIPKDEAVRLKHGMSIELLDPEDKVIGISKIFYISPTVDTKTQSVLVKSLYPNDSHELRPAQNVTARVVWGHAEGIVVPTKALAVIGGQPFVFVAEKDKDGKLIARQKPVELGQLQGGNGILVEKGLKQGEKMVVSGIQNLSDGALIALKKQS